MDLFALFFLLEPPKTGNSDEALCDGIPCEERRTGRTPLTEGLGGVGGGRTEPGGEV